MYSFKEPIPANYPLLKLKNVTLTSHLAGYCSDIFEITTAITVNEIETFCETGEWINAVNK